MAQVDELRKKIAEKRAAEKTQEKDEGPEPEEKPSAFEHSEEEVRKAEEALLQSEEEEKQEIEEAKPPSEKFTDFVERLTKFLDKEMPDFRLKIKRLGETEIVVYQGTLGNVWARLSPSRMRFYRATLERRLEREGLIEATNEVGRRFR